MNVDEFWRACSQMQPGETREITLDDGLTIMDCQLSASQESMELALELLAFMTMQINGSKVTVTNTGYKPYDPARN